MNDGCSIHLSFVQLLVCALVAFGCVFVSAADKKDDLSNVKPKPSNGKGGKVGTFAAETIDVDGKPREYRLVVPKSVDPKKPAPLIFAFHGLLDSKDLMPMYSQLDKLAESKGCLLVYPNGRGRMWPLVQILAKDDLAFFDALYAHMSKNYNVDLNRVYLTGMSNGAYFSNLVASLRSDKIAAIAPHSGGLAFVGATDLNVAHKYAVLAIHGTNDSIVPVRESQRTRDMYKKWGHPVEYIEIPNHNHFWATGQDINEKIWSFFMKHPFDK